MHHPYIIGLDIGTGSTKAVAVDNKGSVVGSKQVFYPVAGNQKSEQAIEIVWTAFCQCISLLVQQLKVPPMAVSLSSAMHSIMAVDAAGRPLTKALLWSDTRSAAIAAGLRSTPLGESLYQATGTPLHAMSPLCKIRWMKESAPGVFAAAAKFISLKEAIWHRLFGEYVIDHSLASATGLFDVHNLDWHQPALAFAGIGQQQLSVPVPVSYGSKNMGATMAKTLSLPAGTPFFVGASDGCLANLGSGCLEPTAAAITIGTSAAVRITTEKPVPAGPEMLFTYRLDEKTFVCGGASNNGGNVFQWLLKSLYAGSASVKTYDELFTAIASVPAGCQGLLFLPYLHGERAPLWDEVSSGAFLGLRPSHTLAHMARAAAEGVCFALLHILSVLEKGGSQVKRLHVSGGLVQSAVIMQLLATVTGKDVVVSHTEDASAIGAVYLAQKALGIIASYSSLPEKKEQTYRPQKEAAVYPALFSLYQAAYMALRPTMHSLRAFS